jgi:integral membrane sensor domain MASE1
VRLAACFLWVTFASVIVGYVEQWKPENNLLWVANGLILAYLLLAPRKLWPAYLLTGFLALSLRMLLLSARRDEFLLYNLLDMIEVTTGALLLRRLLTWYAFLHLRCWPGRC